MSSLLLSPRLKIIADSINKCDCIADIGTDHAYLPIYLVKNNKVKTAIASDVNQGPVDIAKKRVEKHNTEKYIEVRKGNGLEVLQNGEADIINIAGMGGLLIKQIIENNIKIAKESKLLILQPMRDSDILRRYLVNNGFVINDEELIKDDGRIYEIIWCKKGIMNASSHDLMLVGSSVLSKKHPLVKEFIEKKVCELQKIVNSIDKLNNEACKQRVSECNVLIKYYRELQSNSL